MKSETEKTEVKNELTKRESELIRGAYEITSIISLAHFNPKMLVQCIDIEVYPGEQEFAFTDQQLRDYLLTHRLDFSLETINEILELGLRNAFYGKLERKNKKGKFVCNAWVISGI